ncbi:ABC transporter ATP-binding protein/permease [Gammaproteobacteria bacterium]|nr:ABC transporter ATP-binding protein/permease [Gammaproteobacteria bacterium]
MLNKIKKLFTLLTPSQRKRFYVIQVLIVFMSIGEIVGVASIIPFMSIVGDVSQLQEDTIFSWLYIISGSESESEFIFLLGIGVLCILFLSSLLSMFTTWKLSMFANRVGVEISDRLYTFYLKQGWLFHASGSSALLTKKIANETQRITGAVIMPLMQMNAKILLSILMAISIFVYDPKVAIVGLSIFGLTYIIIYKLIKVRLIRNGLAISDVNEERFRLMNEGFGGIKDILLLGRDYDFIDRFNQTGNTLAKSQGENQALSQMPRYFMELIAFSSMISLVLYLIISYEGNLSVILPIISIYALAAFKILPALQAIYSSVAKIRGNIAAFDSIEQDLVNSKIADQKIVNKERALLHLNKQISLNNITFNYPDKKEPTLKNLNITIPVNSLVGIVGPSGSGKSTLIDILMGLIKSQQGELKIDDEVINDKNLRSWKNTIGFVAQNIFLSEGTIAQNIAFGVPQNKIDISQVEKVLELAHLRELILSLEYGIHTPVGERGVQLSGGQRQRIGIARALYHEAEVLVFDEATSSLDGITEKIIMEAINNFSGKKTIILIAHRLKTVQKCNQIFYMDKGEVVDQGTFDELIEKNKNFKNMAKHS